MEKNIRCGSFLAWLKVGIIYKKYRKYLDLKGEDE
jgi:hypothetical protein